MSKNLFSIVSENLQGALDNGKTPVGYTVKNYQGVLSALQKAKVVYNQIQKTRVSTSIGSRRYTLLKQTGLEGADDDSGFIVHQNSNELSYQALCVVKEYMSFVVDYTVPNEENKKARSWVGVRDRPSKDSHALKGITLQSSGISFPPVEEDGINTITRMSQTLGGDNEPCKIGVGLSLNNLAYNFMKRFFPQLKLTEEQIESLASKGYLNAEVLIPKGKGKGEGESAFVLHARVTVKHEINDESAPFQVWIPVPIMLLNSFKKLGTVTVEAGVGQQEKVGETNVTFPFANSTYNHENAEISNFTPSSLKAFALSQDTPVQYVRSNLCNEGIATQARVRLYFIESSKADIQKTIGKPIPEAYAKELFKGKVDVIKVEPISPVGTIVASTATGEVTYKPGQINWDKFRANHIRGKNLSKEHADAIETVCRMYNINTRMAVAQIALETGWFDSTPYKQKNNVGGLTVPGYYVDRNGKTLGSSAAIRQEYPNLEERYRAYRSKYNCGQRYTLPRYGNVSAKAAEKDDTRGEGNGYYWIFDNIQDGYKAWAHLVCNSQRYGINVKKPSTVGQHFTNLARGGYAESSGTYAQQLTDIYNRLGEYV